MRSNTSCIAASAPACLRRPPRRRSRPRAARSADRPDARRPAARPASAAATGAPASSGSRPRRSLSAVTAVDTEAWPVITTTAVAGASIAQFAHEIEPALARQLHVGDARSRRSLRETSRALLRSRRPNRPRGRPLSVASTELRRPPRRHRRRESAPARSFVPAACPCRGCGVEVCDLQRGAMACSPDESALLSGVRPPWKPPPPPWNEPPPPPWKPLLPAPENPPDG